MKKLNKIVLHPWLKVDDLARHINKIIDYLESDTVLGEERKIGGHTYSKSGKDMCCQPLTEGECKKCRAQEEFHYEGGHKFEPQESNKEEMGKGCYTDKLGQLVHDIPHTCQEPSKKPSMTIGCNECGNNITI